MRCDSVASMNGSMSPSSTSRTGPSWTSSEPLYLPAPDGVTAATPGNGNGAVAGAYNSGTATDESRLWWDHLRRAGFVAGTGTQQPFNAVTGLLGVQTGNAAGATALGGFSALIVCSANMPDKIAIAVDTQMDDGTAATGTVRGQLHAAGPNPAIQDAAPAANYAETGTNVYTLCRSL